MRTLLSVLAVLAIVSAAFALPHNTPMIDGHVTVDPNDWDLDEWAVDDSPYDNRWGANDADLDDLYVTWDEYALYVGITTTNTHSVYGNGYLLYIDTDAQNGVTGATDFTYADFYPRNITFSTMGVDVLLGVWNLDVGTLDIRHCSDPTSTTPVEGTYTEIGPWWLHIETGMMWDGLYGLGNGVVPPGTTLRFIAAIVGGVDSGAYDAMPNTSTGVESDPGNPWYAYTDLDVYFEVVVDANGDGAPDTGVTPVVDQSWGRIKSLFLD
jgi:hypothetical protein